MGRLDELAGWTRPQARVVRLANADHAVYRSNLEDVLRELDEFVATLT